MDHQQASSSRNMVPGLPILHGHSRSLNTVATSPEMHGNLTGSAYNIVQPMQSPELESPMQPYHGHSKSIDVEAVNHNNLAIIKQEAYDMMLGGYSHTNPMQHGYHPNEYVPKMPLWYLTFYTYLFLAKCNKVLIRMQKAIPWIL